MSVKRLREQVLEANQELVRHGLVIFTFGNASGFDRSARVAVSDDARWPDALVHGPATMRVIALRSFLPLT